jgi:hypothetical protein
LHSLAKRLTILACTNEYEGNFGRKVHFGKTLYFWSNYFPIVWQPLFQMCVLSGMTKVIEETQGKSKIPGPVR